MQKHTKVFMGHYGYCVQDIIMCQRCRVSVAVDIHHIVFRSQGGGDDIGNLIALCRKCHDLAHARKITKEELSKIIQPCL